jgi:LacI family transcriptional regulator
VLSDNAGGAARGVAHLVAAGHRRIAFLGDRPTVFTAAERLRGYREALLRHGIEEDAGLVRTVPSPTDAYTATCELLLGSDPPTAVFAAQNLITIEVVRALHDIGLAAKIGMVGFDDVALADVVRPGVTVVAQDPTALGRQAAELLFSRLDGYDGPSRRLVLDTRLVARGSGEIAPGGSA